MTINVMQQIGLMIKEYDLDSIEYVKAFKVNGSFKADIQVHIIFDESDYSLYLRITGAQPNNWVKVPLQKLFTSLHT